MPKISRARAKSRSSPVSLEETLKRDNVVQQKHKKQSQKNRDSEDSEDESTLRIREDLAEASAKELAKLEKLSRDAVELDDEDFPPVNESSAWNIEEEDLTAYPEDAEFFSTEAEESPFQHAPGTFAAKTLGDLIFEKLEQKSREQAEAEKLALFNPATKELFESVGVFMSRYRSGKLPKALRFIPNLKNWLDILWLTKPENWTPHATAAATPMFVNNTPESQARKFMSYILLPAFQKSIDESVAGSASGGRLNPHLYKALCMCLHRPTLFFKAIYFPVILSEEGCTYRYAVILSSIVAKQSFPAIQAAAVLIKLCKHEPQNNQIYYSILRLLNKKHDLPISAISIIAAYFLAQADRQKSQTLPVIWHQCLLVFLQRWKSLISVEQKAQFKRLFKVHFHPRITNECRRELFASREEAEMGE